MKLATPNTPPLGATPEFEGDSGRRAAALTGIAACVEYGIILGSLHYNYIYSHITSSAILEQKIPASSLQVIGTNF